LRLGRVRAGGRVRVVRVQVSEVAGRRLLVGEAGDEPGVRRGAVAVEAAHPQHLVAAAGAVVDQGADVAGAGAVRGDVRDTTGRSEPAEPDRVVAGRGAGDDDRLVRGAVLVSAARHVLRGRGLVGPDIALDVG